MDFCFSKCICELRGPGQNRINNVGRRLGFDFSHSNFSGGSKAADTVISKSLCVLKGAPDDLCTLHRVCGNTDTAPPILKTKSNLQHVDP